VEAADTLYPRAELPTGVQCRVYDSRRLTGILGVFFDGNAASVVTDATTPVARR